MFVCCSSLSRVAHHIHHHVWPHRQPRSMGQALTGPQGPAGDFACWLSCWGADSECSREMLASSAASRTTWSVVGLLTVLQRYRQAADTGSSTAQQKGSAVHSRQAWNACRGGGVASASIQVWSAIDAAKHGSPGSNSRLLRCIVPSQLLLLFVPMCLLSGAHWWHQ
jgi:hypothetical protein